MPPFDCAACCSIVCWHVLWHCILECPTGGRARWPPHGKVCLPVQWGCLPMESVIGSITAQEIVKVSPTIPLPLPSITHTSSHIHVCVSTRVCNTHPHWKYQDHARMTVCAWLRGRQSTLCLIMYIYTNTNLLLCCSLIFEFVLLLVLFVLTLAIIKVFEPSKSTYLQRASHPSRWILEKYWDVDILSMFVHQGWLQAPDTTRLQGLLGEHVHTWRTIMTRLILHT